MARLGSTTLTAIATGAVLVSAAVLPRIVYAQESQRQLVESPLTAANIIETAVGLVVVLVIMLGLAWLYRRFVQVPGAAQGQIQVLGGVSLGTREKAVLLSVHGRRVLVGVAPGRVQALMTLEGDRDADAQSTAQGVDFDSQLEQATRERTTHIGEAST